MPASPIPAPHAVGADGRYVLRRLLGSGGMADVHLAHDTVLGREVAVKLLRAVDAEASDRARFTAEARTLAALSHPHLVTVLDAGTTADQPYLVMPLVEGPGLVGALAETAGTGLAPERVARIGEQLAGALDACHRADVIHRDVKPGNVLLRDTAERGDARVTDHAYLTDFGIARLLGDTARHTATGFTVGTAAYLSPEQVRGVELTPACDVYSLGLVLIEALSGRRVYPGTAMESAVARLHAPPPVPENLSPTWRDTLTRMTTLAPEERLSASDAASALRSLVSEPAEETRALVVAGPGTRLMPTVPAERRRVLPLLVGAGVLSAVVAVVLALVIGGGSGSDAPTPVPPPSDNSSPAAATSPTQTPAPSPSTAPTRTPTPTANPGTGGAPSKPGKAHHGKGQGHGKK